jgi:GLPGLI family protein
MKRIVCVAAIAALWLSVQSVEGQLSINIVNSDEVLKTKTIDSVLFSVQYRMKEVIDTLHPERALDEMMMLKVGVKGSVYYSYAKFLQDSVLEVDKANGASIDVITEHIRSYISRVNYKIYKNYPTGKVTTLEQLATSRFRCEEVNERPDWELLPDTLSIAGYLCRKATCRFKGRSYEAWFTDEIPRSEGPWKLHGLPGLILRAEDSRHEYLFECTGLTQSRGGETIQYGGDTGYEPISRRELNRVFERYAADPIGFISASAPYVQIQMQTPDGQPAAAPKNIPYNPIERTEK